MKTIVLWAIIMIVGGIANAQNEKQQANLLLKSIYNPHEPGISVIIQQKNKTLYQNSIGVKDLESKTPITAHTNFNICSLTKQFTAYAVVKLSLEKKLSLDDSIARFFPDMNPRVARKIRVRNLLNHSSGLIDHYDQVNRKAYTHFWDKDAYMAIRNIDSTYFPVGSSYRYSNTAFCLLALIIEKVSGKSYPEFIKENIFDPLQMKQSLVLQNNATITNQALGYDSDKADFRLNDIDQSIFFSTMGDGGIYTSIDDYSKWINAISHKTILNKQIIELVQSKQNLIDAKRDLHYGFGWFVSGTGKNLCYYHTGSNGGFRTLIYINPSADYSVALFSNRTGIDLEELAKKLNKIFHIDNSSFIALGDLIS